MHTFEAQALTTLRGGTNISITQARNGWLDLSGYQDVVGWLDVQQHTGGGGTVQMAYQTSPVEDDATFVNIIGPNLTMPLTTNAGIQITPMLKETLTVPLARWFRWQLVAASGSSAWSLTFRLFLSANCLVHRESARQAAMAGRG